MLYDYGKRMRDFFEAFFFSSLVCSMFGAFLIKQLFHSPLLDMDDYSQLSAMYLVGYLTSHIQCVLVEQLLIIQD